MGRPTPKPGKPKRAKPKPDASGWDHRRPHAPRGNQEQQPCCPMVAAVRSAKRGKFRLASRYALMSGRLIAARVMP